MRLNFNPSKIIPVIFYLFLALIFIHPFISEIAYPALGLYIRIAILIIFFSYLLISKGFRITSSIFNMPILLYITSMIISLFYSINLRSSLHHLYQVMPLLCLFFFASSLEKKQTAKVITTILISASILSIYGIYQYLWGFEHTKEYLNLHLKDMLETRYVREILITGRAIATFFSPNMFASYLIMAIPLSIGVLSDNTLLRRHSFFLKLSLTFIVISLLLTKSLAAWISLALGLIIFLNIFPQKGYRKLSLIFTIFILIAPLFILLLRHDMFINLANQQNTILQRLSFWRSAIEIIKDFPINGVGVGNLENIYPKYKELMANETRFAHNILLQTWVETGLPGTIALILLILSFIRVSFRVKRAPINIALIISCYIFIINNLLDFSYFIPQVSFLWWINLGLISQRTKAFPRKSDNLMKIFIALIVLLVTCLNIKSLIALNYYNSGEYKKAAFLEPYNDVYHMALKNYDKAIELNPYSPFYHKKLAMLYLDNNMIKKAISEFEKASQLYPTNISLHQQLFELYKKAGDEEKAGMEQQKIREFYSRYSGYFIR